MKTKKQTTQKEWSDRITARPGHADEVILRAPYCDQHGRWTSTNTIMTQAEAVQLVIELKAAIKPKNSKHWGNAVTQLVKFNDMVTLSECPSWKGQSIIVGDFSITRDK